MARIDQWGRWPVILVWLLSCLLSLLVLLAAFGLEDVGAELAAAVMVLNITLLFSGAMAVTWRWLTQETSED